MRKGATVRELGLGQAVDRAIEDAMARDESIVLIGEDVPMLRAAIFARFGPERVLAAPISEAAFVGAAAGAAMAGLRPVVELYMVDFVAVAFDEILVAVGRAANTQGYGLEELGISVTPARRRGSCGPGVLLPRSPSLHILPACWSAGRPSCVPERRRFFLTAGKMGLIYATFFGSGIPGPAPVREYTTEIYG